MINPDIAERLEGFEARLARLEALLGVSKPRKADQPAKPAPVEPLHIEAVEAADVISSDAPDEVQVDIPLAPAWAARQTPPPLPVMPHLPKRAIPSGKVHKDGLEQTIGLKWAGWIGAIVLVIGAAFGIKFVYDQGWFSIITPTVRLGLSAIVAFALIAAGEWVYRKVNVLSAVGLFGAGVALLFVISFAGHAYFGLYEKHAAFTFMALSTIIGAAVARRGQMVSIAVLAMIGGNLAPILLTNGQPAFFGFLTYILLLQLTSLVMAAWGATPKWWTLRGLSLATTSLWVGIVIDTCPPQMMLIFVLIYAALFHAELHFSAHRSRFNAAQAGVTFSMLVSTALTLEILYLQRNGTQTDRLVSLLGLAGILAVISFICRRIRQNSEPLRALALGYAIQSMALLAVAVPIAFSGIWITVAWCVLAVTYATTGRLLNLATARRAAPVAWCLAGCNLFFWVNGDYAEARRHLIAIHLGGCEIPLYLLVSGLLVIAGRIVARLSESGETDAAPSQSAIAISFLTCLIWAVASLNALSPAAATVALLFYTNFLLLEDRFFKDRNTLKQSVFITILVTLKWAAFDTLLHRLNDSPAIQPVLFSAPALVGTAVLISLILLYFITRSLRGIETFGTPIKQLIGGLIVGVLFWIGTFTIDQAFINDHLSASPFFTSTEHGENVALSVFWSIFAISTVIIGLVRNVPGLRYFGLTLFGVTLLKVVTVDMSQVSTGYRILSFMALGILLLGTSVLYGKVSPKLQEREQAKQI